MEGVEGVEGFGRGGGVVDAGEVGGEDGGGGGGLKVGEGLEDGGVGLLHGIEELSFWDWIEMSGDRIIGLWVGVGIGVWGSNFEDYLNAPDRGHLPARHHQSQEGLRNELSKLRTD